VKHAIATLGAAALAVGMQAAAAKPDKEVDLNARYVRYHVTYHLNADGTDVQTRDTAIKVLKERAVENLKQTYMSYSTSVEKVDVLEAYTLKADGRRIDAPKSNYQLDINKGRESDAPAFSDRTTLTVILPDVAVGDTLVVRSRLTRTEPIFPGHFSTVERFGRMDAYDDVKVRVEAPASMWTRYTSTAMAETVKEENGLKVVEWTWSNPKPMRAKRTNFSVYDAEKEPGFSYSTFRNYEQIAKSYGERARPKAQVTDRVRTLADEIAKDATNPRDQARALYEWVATNIHYAGNCVGVGAVVPRDLTFVLDNKMGDCKDHATLLQALLAAKGIESSQALVNAGSSYKLPEVPVVSMVNHVINYIPSLDMYVDSTSDSTPFGMLPTGDADKPVLLVDNYRDGTRTPPTSADANRQVAKSDLTVKEDGSVSGSVQVALNGLFAVSGRETMRQVTPDVEEKMMESYYKRNNSSGGGKIEKEDPKALLDNYKYKVTFETEEFASLPGAGAFSISPMYSTEAPVQSFLMGLMNEDEEAEEISCLGGSTVEEYTYRLPKNMKVLSVPKNVSHVTPMLTYRATYSLKGSTLVAKRELVDKTRGNVCPASVQQAYREVGKKVMADLKAQVVYR
jgi:transglutaminase-like putative cysteine protease